MEVSTIFTGNITSVIAPMDGNPVPILLKERPFVQIVVEICVLCLLWAAALLGNGLVCVVIYRSRRLQSTTNYFVVSLACADIVLVTACAPFLIGQLVRRAWIFGSVVCKAMRFAQFAGPASTMTILVSICVDRFYSILYPLCFKVTRGRAKKMIIFSWFLTIVVSCPTLYFFKVVPVTATAAGDEARYICVTYIAPDLAGMFYTVIIVLVEYVLPIVILLFGYTRVFNYIWSMGVGGRTVQRTTNSIPRAKVKMIKMILIMNIAIVTLLGPFYMLQLWHTFAPTRRRTSVDPTVYVAVWWMVLSGGVAKPLVYVLYNSNFRRGCREVFWKGQRNDIRSLSTIFGIEDDNVWVFRVR
ncbi:putative G-protein coupled receptor 19 [Tubulanus polymorphus]|uniref:putative G-protein coupled receptor 19 n=1 Tax=Tubulanus polymorphus TaxID=672921 RepID=UPI003DA6119C